MCCVMVSWKAFVALKVLLWLFVDSGEGKLAAAGGQVIDLNYLSHIVPWTSQLGLEEILLC